MCSSGHHTESVAFETDMFQWHDGPKRPSQQQLFGVWAIFDINTLLDKANYALPSLAFIETQ